MRYLWRLFILIFMFGIAIHVYAVEGNIGMGYQWNNGTTTYQIGGALVDGNSKRLIHFPLSELKFPLNVNCIQINGSLKLTDRLSFSTQFESNVTQQLAGKMEDSDWIEQANIKDIFSTSDANLNFSTIFISMDYLLNTIQYTPNFTGLFYAGVSYRTQKLGYTLSNLFQTYPTQSNVKPDIVTGNVITYSQESQIPYFFIKTRGEFKHVLWFPFCSVDLTYAYSPFVRIIDRDDHLLRNRLAVGNYSGYASRINLSSQFWVNPHFSFSCGGSYEDIQTNGTQVLSFYNPNANIGIIDAKVVTHLYSVYIYCTYWISPP